MNIISKLPWQGQIGAFVLLAAGGIAGFEYATPFGMERRADIDARAGQLRAIRADIEKGRAAERRLPEFKGQVTELEGRLANLRAILPEEKDAEDLLRRLQTVAVQSNITIKNFKPEATVTKQLHAEWPITLQLDGTYHNLALFFDRVGKFTRIVNISNVDIKGKDKPVANSTISASCTATTFVLLEKPAAPKPGAKPGAGAPAKS
jgi:type IV pilus assembly protein PilO